MNNITSSTFTRAVVKYFEPIAREHAWNLVYQRPDLYEIKTPFFVTRIRFHAGAHSKSINATLIPADKLPGDSEKGGKGELGVAVIAGFNGIPMEHIPRESTEDGFLAQAEHVANLVKEHAMPYLLGEKSDWHKIEEFIQKEKEMTAAKIRKYQFPPQVQKRWHLPPPKS